MYASSLQHLQMPIAANPGYSHDYHNDLNINTRLLYTIAQVLKLLEAQGQFYKQNKILNLSESFLETWSRPGLCRPDDSVFDRQFDIVVSYTILEWFSDNSQIISVGYYKFLFNKVIFGKFLLN